MLQATITNNIRIRTRNVRLKALLTKPLTIDNPEYLKRKQRGKRTYGIDRKLKIYAMDQGDIVAPRGFENILRKIVREQGIDPAEVITVDQNPGQDVDFGKWNPEYKLRGFQAPAVEAITKENGVLVAPAGSGKTIMGMKYIYKKGRSTLWLTHTKDLMYQSRDRARSTLSEVGQIGIIGDSKRKWGDGKLIIATIQTLAENPDLITALDDIIGTVVVDEAHHIPAPMFFDVVGKFRAENILGVTATPQRKDKLEDFMYQSVGPKLYTITREDLYTAGFLIKPKLKFVYTDFSDDPASKRNDLNSVDAGGEDLNYNELMKLLISDKDRAELVAENILAYWKDYQRFSLVISESIRYCFKIRDLVAKKAQDYQTQAPVMEVVHGGISQYSWRVAGSESEAELMVEAGEARRHKYSKGRRRWLVEVPQYTDQEYNDWQVTGKDRRELLDRAENNKLDILFATQLAREGLDYPHLYIGHVVTPKRGDQGSRKDGAAVEQEVGRVQRPDPENPDKKAIWIDYVDYNVGVFKSQYYSRRKVYKRLGFKVPNKPRDETKQIEKYLDRLF